MIAKGILTNGLGGNASNMILGQFNLGFFEVTITPEPPITPPPVTPVGGIGGDPEIITKQRITFTIRRKGVTWQKSYVIDESKGKILIRITKVINKVIDRINITIKGIKKKLGSIDISLWKR